MNTKNTILFLLFFFFFSKPVYVNSLDNCSPTSCSPTGPQIRFPFRLLDRQPSTCGFPGFDLTCNNKNKTLLHLFSSQSFMVNHISYNTQAINIEPNHCSPKRINDINLHHTPFEFSEKKSYTFFNCSSSQNQVTQMMLPFSCLGSGNDSVFAVQTSLTRRGSIPESCSVMTTVFVPIKRYDDVTDELTLIWSFPYCKSCESDGGTCGMKSEFGETVCYGVSSSSSHGLPRGLKYGLSLGIGLPVLICIIVLIFYCFNKVNNYSRAHLQSIDLLTITVTQQPPTTTTTIESYPKIVLGESCRLVKDDGICPICLSDYKPKESVRTIPECNHYFHAECIDEWLKLNGTCPVCRNSPETLLMVTPCSPVSSHAATRS